MIEQLLPSQVVAVAIWGDDPSAFLLKPEADQFGWAVESRTREFATARTCARRALEQLGLPAAPVLRGPSREPIWPAGVVGSITHCRGYRAAAVARQSEVITIGIDAEVHEPLPPEVLEQVALSAERTWLKSAPMGMCWDRLLFSAKESVYKAWYPLSGQWLDFEDVEVTCAPAAGTFEARLLVPSPAVAGQPMTGFKGRFVVREGLVLTAIALLR